jgi:signal transduction histidine kinase
VSPDAFGALARLLPDPLMLTDQAGAVLATSDGTRTLLGAVPATLHAIALDGREHVDDLLRRFRRSSRALPGALTVVLQGAPARLQVWGGRVDSSSGSPLLLRLVRRDGEGNAFSLLTRQVNDLTREVALRRASEAERARALAQEQEARAHAEQAVEALTRAEAGLQLAVAARDQLIWVASHELRTPLNALGLQLQGLARSAGALDARAQRRVDTAQRQVARLARLVDELLDVTRITSGELLLELEDVDLVALITDVAERDGEALAQAGCALSLTLPAEPVVGRWDPLRLEQALQNLLANAIKFGAGKPISISLVAAPERVSITVADHGIGIAEADHQRIFQRFERAVTHQRFGGLGLGLWIVGEVARACGGAVRVESRPGEGARFILELPRRP